MRDCGVPIRAFKLRNWAARLRAAALSLAAISVGCVSVPPLDNPVLIRPAAGPVVENPVFVPQGPGSYGVVFERVLSVVDSYFEVRYSNRYDGQIITFPRIAPGFGEFWKPGSPDACERALATLQTIRHRAEVRIDAANDGGYFVQVTVFKELEDLPQPIRSTAGAAIFRGDNTVERQFEVIDPAVFENGWIPLGRDEALEQAILQQIRQCL
jgi:hypothetical protein